MNILTKLQNALTSNVDTTLITNNIENLTTKIENDETIACLNYLRNQVILVKPEIIVLLGSVALKNILGQEYGITAFNIFCYQKE